VRTTLPRDVAVNKSKSLSKIPSPNNKLAGAKSSSDLLMKRFQKDLQEVLEQFECSLDSRISEVTMTQIMALMGFIQLNNNTDIESVQSIW